MPTTYCAFVETFEVPEGALDSSDDLTINLPTRFWENDDGTVTVHSATVPVSFSSGALVASIDDAITDALVDYADTEWSWVLPRNRCIFPTLKRGLLV